LSDEERQSETRADGEADPLPWLQRVEEDDSGARRSGGVAAYLGAGAVVAGLGALIYFGVAGGDSRRPPAADDANLSAMAGTNLSAPVEPKPDSSPKSKPGTKGIAHPPGPVRPARESGHAGASPSKAAVPPKPAKPEAERKQAPAAIPRADAKPKTQAGGAKRSAGFSAGRSIVQLGAYRSPAAAERAWAAVSKQLALKGAAHRVEQARVKGRVYYRLRVQPRHGGCTGLATKAKGCFVVRGPAG
jgi:hypothetical protein